MKQQFPAASTSSSISMSDGKHAEAIAQHASAAEARLAEAEATIMSKLQTRTGSAKQGFKMLNARGDKLVTAGELRAALAARFDLALSEVCAEYIVAKYGSSKGMHYSGFCELYEGTRMASLTSAQGSTVQGLEAAHDAHGQSTVETTIAESTPQREKAVRRKVGDKLRSHASVSSGSRHFTALFLKLDAGRSGSLSPNEISTGLARLGIELTVSELGMFLDRADTAGDGAISVTEFAKAMGAPPPLPLIAI